MRSSEKIGCRVTFAMQVFEQEGVSFAKILQSEKMEF